MSILLAIVMSVDIFWEGNVTCEFCETILSSEDALKQHLKLHSRRKPYKCDECNARFSYNSTLEWHRRSHCGEMPFKCTECSAQFPQNSMLIWHKRKHSVVEPSHSSPIVVNMANIYHHHHHHQNLPMFSVPSIMTASTTPVTNAVPVPMCANEHMGEFSQADIQVLPCSSGYEHPVVVTSESSPIEKDLQIKESQNSEGGLFHCDICNTSFSYSTELKRHMETKHNVGENNPFHILAKQQQTDVNHSVKRKMIQEKLFKCDLCYAGFNTEGHLKCHRKKHIVDRPYKCMKCGLSFTDRLILESHERRHQTERPFKCNRCGASFFRESHLEKHIKRHTGELV